MLCGMPCRGGPCAHPHPGRPKYIVRIRIVVVSVTLRCHSGCGRAQGPPLHVQTASSQFLEAFDDVVYVWVVVIVYGILVPS